MARHVRVAGDGAEDELQPRLIDEHKGPGVFGLEAVQLGVDPAGHEVHQGGPHVVIEDQRPVVFIQDLQAETDGAFQLPPDGDIAAQVQLQKAMIDHGILGGDVKIVQVVPMLQEFGQALHKFSRIEPDTVFFREEQDAGEMLRRLDIHVFIIAQVGQLGPEGDVQGEGEVQGRLRLFVGQDGHGGGVQITGDQCGHHVGFPAIGES